MAEAKHLMRADVGELISEVQQGEGGPSRPLGTAEWMGLHEASGHLTFPLENPDGSIWVGEALDSAATPLGYGDDRHVCMVSGTRGGKGTGVIIPNLCLWPGSAIVIDPKGENAQVCARRRGAGSEFARGLGQKVCILDPFGEVDLPAEFKARFNPLDVIDPTGDLAVSDAGRIAASIIPRESKNDPFWEDAARNLVKGVILHVLSHPAFEGTRNLVTVRQLLTAGDRQSFDKLKEIGEAPKSAFTLLWNIMRESKAFDGTVAGVGEQMISAAEKTRSGILEIAKTNTVFIDGRPMHRLLEASDFKLEELKTNPRGVTIFLVLPQRYMDEQFRWLRMMTSLAVGEMERIKGRPKTGYPTLFLLDEFAGLKRMETIENAVAQAAGFGVKFFFILQNFAQLMKEYSDGWETFVSNSGLKIFFQVDDHFTRDHLSKLLGEQEVRIDTRSGSQGENASQSTTSTDNTGSSRNTSTSQNSGASIGRSYADWDLQGRQRGLNKGESSSESEGDTTGSSYARSGSFSASTTNGWSEGVHRRPLLHPDEIGRFFSRIDERRHPAYPGLLICLMPGRQPLVARRINYFTAGAFAGMFDPHPEHPPPPTLVERERLRLEPPPDVKPPKQDKPAPPRPAATSQAAPDPTAEPPARPQRRPPGMPIADLLKDMAKSGAAAGVLPEAAPPVIPHRPPVQPIQTLGRGRRLSTGRLLPLLILGVGAVTLALKLDLNGQWLQSITARFSHSPAYQDGRADRSAWETWFNGLTGEAHSGADYWASVRRDKPPASVCSAGPGQLSTVYRQACLDARQRLTPTDVRRKEAEYYRGWNSF